ncbi:hypothetical protein [Nocardioides sp. Root151]|uniref:hypothetical protein n=1 Tax=Nocardioides sp. Root151 TaxID=1736475 RepID=UPI0007032ACF|nr:hypothetical protein [Nocardioides sp. Root151]KQZ68830.1 hypothetical protein ASD66_16355 [Nocardioides sp. Root151]
MTDSLAAVRSAIEELAGFDPLYVPMPQKRELMRGLVAAEAQLAAVRLGVLAVAGDVADDAGAKSAASWLSHDQNLDKRAVHADQVVGRGARATVVPGCCCLGGR